MAIDEASSPRPLASGPHRDFVGIQVLLRESRHRWIVLFPDAGRPCPGCDRIHLLAGLPQRDANGILVASSHTPRDPHLGKSSVRVRTRPVMIATIVTQVVTPTVALTRSGTSITYRPRTHKPALLTRMRLGALRSQTTCGPASSDLAAVNTDVLADSKAR